MILPMKKPQSKAKPLGAYDHKKVEAKWQKQWDKTKAFKATEDPTKKKFFGLIEFPYPSGDGLHVGHPRPYIGMDVIARKRRMQGYNVLYPIGWDAFGLPTENYAIKTGIQPSVVTKKNTDTFRRQIQSIGVSFDWSREINTTDPAYYRWTQWIFLQFLKKGLAYKKKMTINWCPKDLIGLANEEVINGCCERCGTPVEKRDKEQWMLAITKYADRLDKDLDTVDFLDRIKTQQRNWIGKSEGAEIKFEIRNTRSAERTGGGKSETDSKSEIQIPKTEITVFTTRPDTLFGVTYVVLAPEHKLVGELLSIVENKSEVEAYISKTKKETDIDRTDTKKEKTGIELKGVRAINPVNGEEVPVWTADYVLADYGTGAVMAVPAHDERDAEFAKKYGLPVKTVIEPLIVKEDGTDAVKKDASYVERNAAVCIIKHWSEDKYLMSFYKANGWKGFVVGGIEGGESVAVTGTREIHEETGYKNAKFVREVGTIHSKFFHAVKSVNRFAHFKVAYFELTDGDRDEMAEEEKKLHDVVWLSPQEVTAAVNREDIKIAWDFFNGKIAYTGDGLLTNSTSFNGKDSQSVKKEITEKAGGKWVTTFKLRDWVFSRQRYWGEPIPVVHCDVCGVVPVPEKDLPLKLPKVKNYKPTETGESPLAAISSWVNTTCPNCVANKKKPKYLIFDFDGVLGNTWTESNEVKVTMGDSPTVEDAAQVTMKHFDRKPSAIRNHTLTAEQLQKKQEWITTFGKHLSETDFGLFKGFIAELKKIKNAKFAVVSSGSSQYVLPALKKAGLKFTHILAYEDHYSKEEKVEKVCKDWGITPKEAYYFTDTKADILELEELMGRDRMIGCAWGWHGYDKLRELLPEKMVMKEFKDIRRVLNLDCSAKRETDTMPNWAGSSWYYLRYTDPKNSKTFASPEKLKYWTPVDWYNGGMEHTTLHLLYSRFWHKFLFDLGLVPTTEPYQKRTSHGLILATGGEKMSKSKGNVINPDSIIETVGADSLRLYEMFMGPFDQPIAWNTDNIAGVRRFIERVWKLREKVTDEQSTDKDEEALRARRGEHEEFPSKEISVPLNLSSVRSESRKIIHKTIKKVSDDIEGMRFNTAMSTLMIALNELEKSESVSKENYENLLQLLAPFAPHVTEELWASLGNAGSVHASPWPVYDPAQAVDSEVTIMIQINGKTRGSFTAPVDTSKEELEKLAKESPEGKKWLEGKSVIKIIVVPNKLINIVITP
jgi:HAD superfamily hydrolase (TIGR01549 family)